jgi:hypothetical protein
MDKMVMTLHHEISFSFPNLKEKLCWHQFQLAEEIVSTTRAAEQDLPANIFQR